MADRFWVGGSGTWDTTSTTNWSTTSGGGSGAAVPTASDAVYFDQNATYTVTLTGALTCLDFNVSNGTVSFINGTSPSLAISGNASIISNTIWNTSATVTFNSTVTGKVVNTNSVTMNGAVWFNGSGGGWRLQSNLSCKGTFAVYTGAMDLNNSWVFASACAISTANTRSIAWGTSSQIVLGSGLGASLDGYTLTGLTYTGTPRFVVNNASGGVNWYYGGGGGSQALAMDLTVIQSGNLVFNMYYGGYYLDLDMSSFTGTLSWGGGGTNMAIYGNAVFGKGMTIGVSSAALMLLGANSRSFTSNGVIINAPVTANIGASNTLTLIDNLTINSYITQASGGLDLSGKTLSCIDFVGSGTRTMIFGSNGTIASAGNVSLSDTGLTVTGNGIISMTSANAKTYSAAHNRPDIILDQGGAGALTISTAGTFKMISNSFRYNGNTSIILGGTQTIASSDTSTILKLLRGSSPTSVLSISNGGLSLAAGFVVSDYLSITNSTATSGRFFAGLNSVNVANVTGWSFGSMNKLDSTGTIYTTGIFDETTSLDVGVASRVDANTIYAAKEFDEITLNPITGGVARKIKSDGTYQVAGIIDEAG